MKDTLEKAPFLELAPGLNGVDYRQKFVKAANPYESGVQKVEACNPNDPAIKATIGKYKITIGK